jgi:pSer/pThr/pTyr-binding forkhead associated (FHA) protein
MTSHLLLHEIGTGKDFTLELPCVVGRSGKVDLTFSDSAISQRHARIAESHGKIWIEDLKSANGVYVNGQRIVEKTVLKSGDLIQLGRSHFQLATRPRQVLQQTLVLVSLRT